MEDTLLEKVIQKEASEALLDIGVSVPLSVIRLPFRKRPVQLRVTMKRPTLGAVMRIVRIYLGLGVTARQMRAFNEEERMGFIASHGKEVCMMISLTVCRGCISRNLLARPLAWYMRNHVGYHYLMTAVLQFILLLGTENFTPFIASIEGVNPLRPRLSQEKKGS